MGPITPAMLTTMEIPWELFPAERPALGAALDRARAHLSDSGRPYALVMPKGCVAPHALGAEIRPARRAAPAAAVLEPHRHAPDARPSRRAALEAVVAHTPPASTVVLAGTGFCGRELYALADRPNQLYMVGSMGCVAPLALGLALARPDLTVLALDGDGAALMRLGVLATIGAYGPPNLRHLLLDNGVHDSTGGQATVSPVVSFAEIAAACGYATALETDEPARIADWLQAPPAAGSAFARLLISAGTPHALPRPSMSPFEVKQRLLQHCRPR
jgi:phosphonopyruvate decarboxylase